MTATTQPARTGGRRLPRPLRPFRAPGYRRLALVLVLHLFAWGVWTVALVWEVIRVGGGATELSWVAGCNALGLMLPVLLAGVVADRVPQKSILLAVGSVYVACIATAAVLSLADLTRLWHLALLALAFGLSTSFFYPAYSAWMPALVAQEDLLAANGFEGMARPLLGQALGPAVAGVVVGASAAGWAIAVAALAALLSLLATFAVPRTDVRRDLSASAGLHPVRSALRDVADGFAHMVRTPWLLATLVYASLMVLLVIGPFEVLVPFLVKDGLSGGPDDHALVLGAFGIGGAVGSLAMAARPIPRRYLTTMNLTWGLGCLPLALYGVVDEVWMLVVLAFVVGACFAGPSVIWGTLLQRRVPPEMLGRVSSLDFFVSLLLMPVSMALAGPVAELVGLRTTFVLAGVLPLGLGVVAVLWARMPQDELAHPLR